MRSSGAAWPLSAAAFASRFAMILVEGTIPVYLVKAGYLPSAAGLVIALAWASSAAGAAAAGLVRDPRLSVGLGMALGSASLLALLALGARWAPPLVALTSAGAGLASSSIPSLLHSWYDGRYGGIGLYSISLSAGLLAGTFLPALVIWRSGFAALFALASVISAAPAAAALMAQGAWGRLPRISLPSPLDALEAFRRSGFALAFAANAIFSFALPVVVSYWGILAVEKFGIQPSMAIAYLGAMYSASAAIRAISSRLRSPPSALWAFAGASLVASVALLAFPSSPSWAIAGLLLFSVPHALVHPLATFDALASSPGGSLVKANYVFSASSAIGEVLSPLAAAVAAGAGLLLVYRMLLPFSLALLALCMFRLRVSSLKE